MNKKVYSEIVDKKRKRNKSFAVLVDPDKTDAKKIGHLVELASEAAVDFIFVGGSLLLNDSLQTCIEQIKAQTNIPLIIFPGNNMQVSSDADAILLLSLISGRNPEWLIGQHVLAAPNLKQSGLEVIPTGYILVDGGKSTSASYMSNTTPIPHDKKDIAMCTAMAGEMLGQGLIYLDTGSGAKRTVSPSMVTAVSQHIEVPLIVGGGITSGNKAELLVKAGADMIVVGNAIEKAPSLISEISLAVHSVEIPA